MVDDVVLVEGRIPEQKIFDEAKNVFPFVLQPAPNRSGLTALLDGIGKQKLHIQVHLHRSCAVLLRGFEVMCPTDFSEVTEALGYDRFEYTGRGAVRKPIVGRVVATDEGRSLSLPIGFHNECSYQIETPGRILFYCDEEPPPGNGTTPIVQGHLVYQRLAKEMPEFLNKVEEKGLLYMRRVQHEGNYGFLQAATKEEAEEKAKRMDTRIEWDSEGSGGMTFMGPRIGCKQDRARNRMVWFNSIDVTYELTFILEKGDISVRYGDGSCISEDEFIQCKRIMEQERVAFEWHKGDVLIVDNDAVLHGRQPSIPPRRILAAVCGY